MSILIKKMEMPATCSDCELYQYGFCMVTRNVCDKAWTQRQDDCPLIEVPTPHGNLIDMDNLLDRIKNPHTDARLAEEITNWIMMSQTIVPTESEV